METIYNRLHCFSFTENFLLQLLHCYTKLCYVYNSFYLHTSLLEYYSILSTASSLRCPTSFQAVVVVSITVILILKLCSSGNSFNVKRFRCLNITHVQFLKLLYCYTKLCYGYNSFYLDTSLLDYKTCWNNHT